MFPFCGIFAISLELVCCTESVQQRNQLICQTIFLKPVLWLTECFLCCTDSVRQTNFNEMAINAKKEEDIVTVLKQLDLGPLIKYKKKAPTVHKLRPFLP